MSGNKLLTAFKFAKGGHGHHDHDHDDHGHDNHDHNDHGHDNHDHDDHGHDNHDHDDHGHDNHDHDDDHDRRGHDCLDHDHDEESHIHHDHHHHEESAALLCTRTDGKSYLAVNEEMKSPTAKKRNVNLHAAYIHVLADLAQSVVVLVAGLIIWFKPTWQLADPICTLIFSIMVCYATIGVIRSSLSVLLEEVPPGINWDEVYDAISDVEGVSDVHDLHIWSISHDKLSLSVHASAVNIEQAYRDIKKVCHREKITHLTLQLQPSTIEDCVTCTDGMAHQCISDPVKRTGSSVH
jgi:zinc transporter 2